MNIVIGQIITSTEKAIRLRQWLDQASVSGVGKVSIDIYHDTTETELRVECRDANTGRWLGTCCIDTLPLLLGKRRIVRVDLARGVLVLEYKPIARPVKGQIVRLAAFARPEQNFLPLTAHLVDDAIPSMPLVEWTKTVERHLGTSVEWRCRARLHSNILLPYDIFFKKNDQKTPSMIFFRPVSHFLRSALNTPLSAFLLTASSCDDHDAKSFTSSFNMLRHYLFKEEERPLLASATRRLIHIWTAVTGTATDSKAEKQEAQRRRRKRPQQKTESFHRSNHQRSPAYVHPATVSSPNNRLHYERSLGTRQAPSSSSSPPASISLSSSIRC